MDETSLQWNDVPTPRVQINIIMCYEVSFILVTVFVPHPRCRQAIVFMVYAGTTHNDNAMHSCSV